jgi:hypothetical protein
MSFGGNREAEKDHMKLEVSAYLLTEDFSPLAWSSRHQAGSRRAGSMSVTAAIIAIWIAFLAGFVVGALWTGIFGALERVPQKAQPEVDRMI